MQLLSCQPNKLFFDIDQDGNLLLFVEPHDPWKSLFTRFVLIWYLKCIDYKRFSNSFAAHCHCVAVRTTIKKVVAKWFLCLAFNFSYFVSPILENNFNISPNNNSKYIVSKYESIPHMHTYVIRIDLYTYLRIHMCTYVGICIS